MTVRTTLECAGKIGVFSSRSQGVQWHLGAVGTADGLRAIVDPALIALTRKQTAVTRVLEERMVGRSKIRRVLPGETKSDRSIRVEKARADVFAATKCRTAAVAARAWAPVARDRARRYVMASMEWLEGIIITEQPFTGDHQTFDYATGTGARQSLSSRRLPRRSKRKLRSRPKVTSFR